MDDNSYFQFFKYSRYNSVEVHYAASLVFSNVSMSSVIDLTLRIEKLQWKLFLSIYTNTISNFRRTEFN